MPGDMEMLKEKGIRAIVDFQRHPLATERGEAERMGIEYIRLPWTAHIPRAFFFPYIYGISGKFLKIAGDRNRLPLYIHCRHGRERTGTMAAVYRMSVEDWPYQKALLEMLRFGVNPFLHFNLIRFLKRFHRTLHTSN